MKTMISLLIIFSFAMPVQARMILKQDPVENDLIQQQPQDTGTQDQRMKQLEEDMSKEFKKPQPAIAATELKKGAPAAGGSNWWKWALGFLVVGGLAAAASGGDGGSSGSPSTAGATVTGSW